MSTFYIHSEADLGQCMFTYYLVCPKQTFAVERLSRPAHVCVSVRVCVHNCDYF